MIDPSTSEVDFSGPAVDLDSWDDSFETKHHSMNLKHQLKLYLEYRELSAAQLAKKSGVSKQVISLWLSGGSPRNVEQIKKVAEILNTSVDHLCFGEGLEKKTEPPGDDWLSGVFEIKVRRITKDKS